jgi:hypothetical protein
MSLEERYELLKKSLARYLLLQVSTFIHAFGLDAIRPAMEILTQKTVDLRVQAVKSNGGDPAEELARNLAISMGDTFNSDYTVEEKGQARSVSLNQCGCIKSTLENSEDYGIAKPLAKSIFCGACMNGYRKSAEAFSVGFKGKLTETGCNMTFSPQ